MPLFKQCCRCSHCGGPIAAGDLPNITIPDYTGGLWRSVAPCCWVKDFTPNTAQDWTFSDGGPLQIDGWTTVSDYEYSWLMSSRGNLVVPGKIRPVFSGNPDAEAVDVGDISWWSGNFEYVVDPYPECPTCETEVCLSVSVSDNHEIMQRWGVYRQLQGITVSIQKIMVTCGEETEPTCRIVMSSRKRYKSKTYFGTFFKRRTTKTYSGPLYGCCTVPANTDDLEDYPDFNSVYSYSADVPPTDFSIHDVISVRVLADLDEQDVSFGWDICDDCIPSGVAFCLGNCSDNCFTTEGTGIVGSGPFGHEALCDYMEPTACTYTQAWIIPGCLWSAQFTWSDGRIDCIKADCFDEFDPYYLPDCRGPEGCEATWTIYTFEQDYECGPSIIPPDDNNLGLVFGFNENGHGIGSVGYGCPAVTIYPPVSMIGTACPIGDPNPQRIGGVGTMTGLSYTPYCSGPIEQTFCFEENWTVTILPTAPDP